MLDINTKKTRFVVVNENTLCYTIESDTKVQVLSASIIRGSHHRDWDVLYLKVRNVKTGILSDYSNMNYRWATEEDFETFRVSIDGYKRDTENYII